MYESSCLGDSVSMNICVRMSRNLSIGMSKFECEILILVNICANFEEIDSKSQ